MTMSNGSGQSQVWPGKDAAFTDNPKSLLTTAFLLELVLILLDLVSAFATLLALVISVILGYVAQQKLKGDAFESNAKLATYNGAFGLVQKLLVLLFPPAPLFGLSMLMFIAFLALAAVGLAGTMMDRPASWFTVGKSA